MCLDVHVSVYVQWQFVPVKITIVGLMVVLHVMESLMVEWFASMSTSVWMAVPLLSMRCHWCHYWCWLARGRQSGYDCSTDMGCSFLGQDLGGAVLQFAVSLDRTGWQAAVGNRLGGVVSWRILVSWVRSCSETGSHRRTGSLAARSWPWMDPARAPAVGCPWLVVGPSELYAISPFCFETKPIIYTTPRLYSRTI